jgi:hypothetical protein
MWNLIFKMIANGLISSLEKYGKEFVEKTPSQIDDAVLTALIVLLKAIKFA